MPKAYTTEIKLFDRAYEPYARSYLCWGKSEALKRHRASLLNWQMRRNATLISSPPDIYVWDPCFPRGLNISLSIEHIFGSPCTQKQKKNYRPLLNITSVVFLGDGNSSRCETLLASLFDVKRNDYSLLCSHKEENCSVDSDFRPPIPQHLHFIGLSGYYHVFNNLAYGKKDR